MFYLFPLTGTGFLFLPVFIFVVILSLLLQSKNLRLGCYCYSVSDNLSLVQSPSHIAEMFIVGFIFFDFKKIPENIFWCLSFTSKFNRTFVLLFLKLSFKTKIVLTSPESVDGRGQKKQCVSNISAHAPGELVSTEIDSRGGVGWL